MSITGLNLNNAPQRKATNFGDQNSVEEFLADKKFRQHCVNLRCSPVQLQHQRLYMPMCDEGRFDRQGIGEAFEMPSTKLGRLSPVTYMVIPIGHRSSVARSSAKDTRTARWQDLNVSAKKPQAGSFTTS
jgi:hypothetical protein